MKPEPDADPALSEALGTPRLGESERERMRLLVEHEWRAAHRPRRSRRWLWAAALAAAAVAAASVVLLVTRTSGQAVIIGSLSKSNGGALVASSGFFRHRTLRMGEPLHMGERLTAHGAVLITLARGGSLRAAAGSELKLTAPNRLSLEHGLIYLDFPPGTARSNPLEVATWTGIIEHVGTGFEVMSDAHAVRVRVREGYIRLQRRSGTLLAEAGTELLATSGNAVARRPINTYGRDWGWTAALAPEYEIEGQSLIGFLQWVGRELGRRVDFDGAHAREVAERTILHGSVRGQPPLDALSHVLASTSLAYELRGDKIWIRPGL